MVVRASVARSSITRRASSCSVSSCSTAASRAWRAGTAGSVATAGILRGRLGGRGDQHPRRVGMTGPHELRGEQHGVLLAEGMIRGNDRHRHRGRAELHLVACSHSIGIQGQAGLPPEGDALGEGVDPAVGGRSSPCRLLHRVHRLLPGDRPVRNLATLPGEPFRLDGVLQLHGGEERQADLHRHPRIEGSSSVPSDDVECRGVLPTPRYPSRYVVGVAANVSGDAERTWMLASSRALPLSQRESDEVCRVFIDVHAADRIVGSRAQRRAPRPSLPAGTCAACSAYQLTSAKPSPDMIRRSH